MSAKNLFRRDEDGIYSHIYNKGVENRTIFNDEEDYDVFLGFLKDYLDTPKDPESTKTDFTISGKTFQGTPHQPKNYYNQVELIAYSLMPTNFHLLVHQITKGSLECFLRSLCTRYSIYFNKKYKRTGGLFEGPYKSIEIVDESSMLHLTHYFHHAPTRSSYEDYLGMRQTSWVKPDVVLSFFGKGAAEYQNFVEKYELDEDERQLIKNITYDHTLSYLQKKDPQENEIEEININPDLKPLPEYSFDSPTSEIKPEVEQTIQQHLDQTIEPQFQPTTQRFIDPVPVAPVPQPIIQPDPPPAPAQQTVQPAFQQQTEVQQTITPAPNQQTIQPTAQPPPVDKAKKESFSIADVDKRLFLKLIGGAGLAAILFSLFNKSSAAGLFSKGAPMPEKIALEDSKGKKIDPAQNQPMDGYRISEIDENVVTFYGFTNIDEGWFIMKEDTDTGSFRYAKGDSNFPNNWTNREKLQYDYYNKIF